MITEIIKNLKEGFYVRELRFTMRGPDRYMIMVLELGKNDDQRQIISLRFEPEFVENFNEELLMIRLRDTVKRYCMDDPFIDPLLANKPDVSKLGVPEQLEYYKKNPNEWAKKFVAVWNNPDNSNNNPNVNFGETGELPNKPEVK